MHDQDSRQLFGQRPSVTLETLSEVIQRLRPRFHQALLEWYRGAGHDSGLADLSGLFRTLGSGLGQGLLADLFRLAETFATSLNDGRLQSGSDARALMAQIDRVLKPLAQQPPRWPEPEARQLIDRLLGLVGQVEPESDLVLDLLVESRAHADSQMLQDPLMDPAEPLKDEPTGWIDRLAVVEEQLELIERGVAVDAATLDAACAALYGVGSILEQTDGGDLSPRLSEMADRVAGLALVDPRLLSPHLESIAVDLLALGAIIQARADERPLRDPPPLAPDLDPADLMLVALRELDQEVFRVQELLAGEQVPGDLASDAGAMLDCVSGVLRFLGLEGAADLSMACGDWLKQCLPVDERSRVDDSEKALSGSLAALAQEISTRAAGRKVDQAMVDATQAALALVSRSIAPVQGAPKASVGVASPELTGSGGPENLSTARHSIAPEFLEIFLEETDEEIASALDLLARWSAEPGDEGALTMLRRSFCAIKGSGLIVGAQRVSEVAEAVERLLSRAIGQPTMRPQVRSFVAEVLDQLPGLIHAESEELPLDSEALVARARALIRGPNALEPSHEAPSPKLARLEDLETPIEDLLDVFEPGTAPPSLAGRGDAAGLLGSDEAPGDLSPDGISDAFALQLKAELSALANPRSDAADPRADSQTLPSQSLGSAPELQIGSAMDRLIEQIREIGRCRSELSSSHERLAGGLKALDQGLKRLSELIQQAANAQAWGSSWAGDGAQILGNETETDSLTSLNGLCTRVTELLDDLVSIQQSLVADQLAAAASLERQGQLTDSVSAEWPTLDPSE
jgi:chemosensory pili system protein ChpA (sensor histidine kinase/response regulator)